MRGLMPNSAWATYHRLRQTGLWGNDRDGGNATALLVLTTSEVGFFLTIEEGRLGLRILLETVVGIGDGNKVVLLVVHQRTARTRGKGVLGDTEDVLDALVGTLNHHLTSEDTGTGVGGVVDQGSDGQGRLTLGVENETESPLASIRIKGIVVVLNIALGNEEGLGGIVDISDGAVGILQLIDLITFEAIVDIVGMEIAIVIGVGAGDGGRGLHVALAKVVGVGVLVGEIEDNLVFEFLSGERGGVGAVEDLEAVLEEALADVVDLTEQLDRSPVVTRGSLGEGNTHGDVVQSTGLEGEGTGRLHETTVAGLVAGGNLVPVVGVG